MWRHAFRHLPQTFSAQRILMLGLGNGCALGELRKRFADCAITVVEWDPVMIDLYREIHTTDKPITILEGDASIIVPQLNEIFDLVVIDLFTGNATPPELQSAKMLSALTRVTTLNGYCILNAFASLNLIPLFDAHFSRNDAWEYQYNTLALYTRT